MNGPDVSRVVEDLRTTGAHVAPAAASWISPEQLAAITSRAEEAGLPVRVVLVPLEGYGIHGGDDLLVRAHDAGAPDGLYVAVNNVFPPRPDGSSQDPRLPDGSTVSLAIKQWGPVADQPDLTDDVELVLRFGNSDGVGDGGEATSFELGDGLQRVVESLADGTFPELVATADEARDGWLDARSEEYAEARDASTSWVPFADDELGAPDVLGVLVVGAVVLALASRFRRRRRERLAAPRTFVLPESVLERVRAAGDAELVRRARRDVLALGEAIDSTEMDGSGGTAWAAALDHYEAAGRVLPADVPDGEVDPLDAAGAVVLATRGLEALAAAERGATFTPTTPCFLHPLHGEAAGDRTLEHDGRTVEAPICAACRADLEAGRRPDTLDVVVDGRPRHYFETDREPWASTGFGALDPDLVRRVHARRPGGAGGHR